MPNVRLTVDAVARLRSGRRIADLDWGYVAKAADVSPTWIARVLKRERDVVQEFKLRCVCGVLRMDWHDLVEAEPPTTKRRGVKKKPVFAASESPTEIESGSGGSMVDMFLAVPMDALGDAYGESCSDVLILLDDIRKKFHAKVFCAVENRTSEADFDDEEIALTNNLLVLRYSTCMLAVIPSRMVTSVLVEIGAAIAFGKPVVLFVKKPDDLPFLLRKTSRDSSLNVIKYKTAGDLRKLLPEAIRILKPKTGWLPHNSG